MCESGGESERESERETDSAPRRERDFKSVTRAAPPPHSTPPVSIADPGRGGVRRGEGAGGAYMHEQYEEDTMDEEEEEEEEAHPLTINLKP